MEVRDRSREIELIVVREAMMRKRMVSGNVGDRIGIQNKEDGSEDRALRHAIL